MNTNQFESLEKSKEIKRIFSRIGFALFLSSIITGFIFMIMYYFVKLDYNIAGILVNFVITYPLVYIMLRKIPRQNNTKKDFSKKDLFKFFLMGVFVLYVGSIIGNILSYLLSRGTLKNPIVDLVSGENLLLKVLVLSVFAPIFEELIFRKLFIDIIAPYDEKMAIIFTAFCFSLFHGNFFQMFYAFGLGLILGYIYVKSKKITNTIILHGCYNFMGAVLPMIFMKSIDVQKLLEIADISKSGLSVPKELLDGVLPGILGYMGYILVYIIMVIAGLVIFVKKRKEFTFEESDNSLSKKEKYWLMFFNIGTIVFTAYYVVRIILTLII